MLRGLGILAICFFALAGSALAAPGHVVIVPEKEGPSKKMVRKELRTFSEALQLEMKRSAGIWQRASIQDAWKEERQCALGMMRDTGPITDLQTLYTMSGIRALQLHVIGPDGKTHASFRESQQRFRKIAKESKTRAIRRLALDKARGVSAIASLPERNLCQWAADWQEAREPDLSSWTGLWKYSKEIREIAAAASQKINYEIDSLLWSLAGGTFSEEALIQIDKRVRWLSSAQPYAQGYTASRVFWKNTLGENYP